MPRNKRKNGQFVVNGQGAQGDVLIIEVDALPEGLTEKKDRTIALGETTGHAHQLENKKNLMLMTDTGGNLFIDATKAKGQTFSVDHNQTIPGGDMELHNSLILPTGKSYRIVTQREHTPIGYRQVMD